jgi:hypothetical protein
MRREAMLGARAAAVLEPGAHVAWDGEDVQQDKGDVFYRVEPGRAFRVHTPAGEVEVKGTCFRVKMMNRRDLKSGTVGAAAAAIALVGVYEGKVAVSRARERVEVHAGEAATTGPDGVQRTQGGVWGEQAFDADNADPALAANQNLADSVRDYKQRLEAIEAQRTRLEKQLKTAQDALAIAQNDGAAPPPKHPYDLSQEDWKELAKNGDIKFALPWCEPGKNWLPEPNYLARLGLSPQDGPVLAAAEARSRARVWGKVKPLCVQALGSSAEVAERLGPSTCIQLVLHVARQESAEAVDDAFRQVGEIRAGLRPAPGPRDPMSPVVALLLATTAEMPLYEADLAQALGPEEAHRVAFSPESCKAQTSYAGHGPRNKK